MATMKTCIILYLARQLLFSIHLVNSWEGPEEALERPESSTDKSG